MTKFLNNINLEAENDIQFKTAAGANAGKIEQDGNNLVLSNAVGDVLLGDGSSDIYIGDGTNNVDILFEQSGSIKGDGSAVTLTIGGTNTTLNLENPNINGSLSLGATTINNKLTFTTSSGYILFDYEPSTGSNAEYTNEVPLLKVDQAGTEKTILSRLTNNGALAIGIDDIVAIVAGDTKSVIKDNINYTSEQVIFSSEGGFIAYGFPSNDTSWANRNEFRFRSESGTASDNGLYIGDGGNTQFIDVNRNLKNIGTISSGAITSSGDITISDTYPKLLLTDTDSNDDWSIINNNGDFYIYNETDSKEFFRADEDSEAMQLGDGIDMTYDNIGTGNSGTVVRGGFLNPAAEANMVHLPHLINDLAGFNKWSNGTITVSGLYGSRSGSSGSYSYGSAITASNSGWANAFDSHSSTAGSWYSDNGTDGVYQHGTDTPGVITLEWPNEITYSLWVGIVFGSVSFSPTYVKIEAYRGGAWQTECEITDNNKNVVLRQVANNVGTNSATTKLRYTLGGSVNGSYFRIHSLYMANYAAGNNNLNNTGTDTTRGVNFLERYKNGYLHGHLYPGADNTYDLGSSSYGWKDLYIDGNITVGGNVDGVDISSLPTSFAPTNADNTAANETSHADVLVDSDFGSAGFMKTDGAGTYSIDTNTYITSQRAISSTPSDGATTTAISSDWAFDNVKTAVPTGAVFTDTVPTDFVSKASGGTFTGAVEVGLSTSTSSSSTGTTFLELDNYVGGDISQQQTFIDFKFTDDNANYTPQVRIGAQVGPDSDANAISKEGAGSFVVYTAPVGSDESGGSTGLAEAFRVSHDKSATFAGAVTIAGDLNVNGTTTTIDTTNLNVEDNNITLNYSTGDSSASAANAGITIQDAVDASNDATMLWDASNDRFTFSHAIVANGTTLTGDQDISGIATNASNIATNATAISNIPAESYTQHENISAATSVNGSGRQYIQDITVDSNGHVTGISTATETVVNTDTNKFLSSVTKPANSNALQFTVTNGTSLSFTFGSNAFNSTTIPTGNAAIDWSTSGEEAVIHSSYYTNTVYTHPQYVTTNIDTSGATIVDSIATNNTGHITAMGTRTLTLSDLGFTGNSAADCVLSSTQNLGNKTLSSCTIDFDSNTISNIEVGNFKASSLVLEAEGISSNDNDTSIPTSAAVKDYVDNAVIADTDTQDLTLSGNTITLDRGGSVDISSATAVAANSLKTSFPGFGTSSTTALRGDTSIPSISGLATETYVDTAETDAIAAAATAAASLYVPNTGTTTIGGTKTFTGSLILNDSSGSSPTMRFMNTNSPTEDEVSIFCNTSGKMKFQQKLASVGSNVVQMTMDENGLAVDNGLKVGTGATITTILDEDDMATDSATALATQQSIKAYVTSSVAGAGGGTMSSWLLAATGTTGTATIEQGETATFSSGTGMSITRSGNQINIANSAPAGTNHLNSNTTKADVGLSNVEDTALSTYTGSGGALDNQYITNGAGYTTNAGTTTASNTQTFTNKSGSNSQWTNDENYLTSIPADSVGMSELANIATNTIIGRTQSGTGDPSAMSMATVNTMLAEDIEFTNKELPRGSIVYGDANGESAELTIGTNGQVLKSNGTDLVWGTDNNSGGGGSSLTIEDEGSALSTAATTLDFVGNGVVASGTGAEKTITITDTVYTHPTTAGNKHIPTGGSTGQFLKYSSSGTATWATPSYTTNTNTQRDAGNGMTLDGNEMDLDIDGQTAVTSARRDTMFIIDDPNDTSANALKKLSLFNMMEDMTDGAQSYTGCLTTNGGTSPLNPHTRFDLSVKCDTSNGAIQTSSSGLQVKVDASGNLGINGNGLTLNTDLTVVDTIYNTGLHVGYASTGMFCDYSNGTNSSTGNIRWYTNTTEIMRLQYEGNLDCRNDVTADSSIYSSDKKLKKNIETLNYGLDEVLKLKPVRYEWKESYKKDKGSMIGFVAQDVQEIVPEIVKESMMFDSNETKLGVDYPKMVAILTKAIQEQQKQIDELKKLVNGNTN